MNSSCEKWKMEVSEKSVLPTSFSRGCFQGSLLAFENESDL